MEAVLHSIALGVIYTLTAYSAGAALRYSPDVRLLLGIISGFVGFGLITYVSLLGVDIQLPKPVSTFLWTAAFFGPLGYISAGPVLGWLDDKTESLFVSEDFDETYRKYAQANKKRHYEYSEDDMRNHHKYHQWRKQSYSRASEGFNNHSKTSSGQKYNRASAHNGLSQKEKMFATLGLFTQNVSAAEIKSAYRKLARKYHPDILASQNLSEAEIDKAMKKMQSINAAYEWLEDNGLA